MNIFFAFQTVHKLCANMYVDVHEVSINKEAETILQHL